MTAAEYFVGLARQAASLGIEAIAVPFPYIGGFRLPRGGFVKFTVDLGYRAVWSLDRCGWEDITALWNLYVLTMGMPHDFDPPARDPKSPYLASDDQAVVGGGGGPEDTRGT